MKLDIKEDSDSSRTLSIIMKWDEIQDDYQKEFNKIKSNYIPQGGRKGKVFGRIGMHFGLNTDYYLTKTFALSSGLSYSQKGFNISQEYWVNDWEGDYEYESEINIELDYIDIPISAIYSLGAGFNIFGGGMISLLVNNKVTHKEVDYSDRPSMIYKFDEFFDAKANKLVFGYQLGLKYLKDSYSLALSFHQSRSFGHMKRFKSAYHNSLSQFLKNNGSKNMNLTVQLSTGYYF